MNEPDLLDFLQVLLCTAAAYLIGSVPATLLIGKIAFGIDIRDHGDGTATHTNVFHILGNNAGAAAILANVIKGFLGSNLAYMVVRHFALAAGFEILPVLEMAFGLATVIGHIMPVMSRFQGGTGVFCALGALLAVQPGLSLMFIGIAGAVVLVSRFQHLGYGIAALALPAIVIFQRKQLLDNHLFGATLLFTVLLSLMIGYTLRDKFQAILRGEAQRVHIRFKRKR